MAADMHAGDVLRLVRQQKAIRAEKRRREQARSQARLAETIEAARAGDPFPFIALQWGRLLRADDVLSDPSLVRSLKASGERFLLLDDFQYDILASLFDPAIPEVYVKGNTGCGKGGAAGIAICTYYAIWDDARVVVSRDTAERAVKVVIGEVHRWWKRMLLPSPGCMLQTGGVVDVSDRTHEIRVVNPDSTEGFTGTHAEHVLVAFDEATAAPLEPFYPLVPTIAHKFLAIANPRTTGGRFRKAFYECVDDDEVDKTQTVTGPNGQRRLITVDGDDILNVRAKCLKRPAGPPGGITIDGRRYEPGEPLTPEHAKATEALIPGQTCLDDHLAICAGDDPDIVAWAGHGRFPQDDKELKIIRRRWLVEPGVAWRRYHEAWRRTEGRDGLRKLLRRWLPIRAFGLDVAGSEAGDASVLTAGGDRGVFRQFEGRYTDATALVDWVLRTAVVECDVDLTQGGCPVGVDVVGLGWGVCGLLRAEGVRVIEIAGNAPSTVDAKTYANLRAEGYGELGRRLDMAGRWGYREAADGETERQTRLRRREIAPLVFLLPPDEMLHEELRAVDKVYGTDGKKFAVTPKRKSSGMKPGTITIHDQIGRSPDHADSLMYFHRALQSQGISLEEAIDSGFF